MMYEDLPMTRVMCSFSKLHQQHKMTHVPATASCVCNKSCCAIVVKMSQINFAGGPVILTYKEYESGVENGFQILNDFKLLEMVEHIQPIVGYC